MGRIFNTEASPPSPPNQACLVKLSSPIMRPATRLFAAVKPQFLEPGAPTGLTGLFTEYAPVSRLSYLYNSTLDKLKRLPETSVYRQSTEALIKHRLAIVESIRPEGFDAWSERISKKVEEQPEILGKYGIGVQHAHGGNEYITIRKEREVDDRVQEWDGDTDTEPALEGTRTEEERKGQLDEFKRAQEMPVAGMELEPEPLLTRDQYAYLL
jgi:NADH dehydrogenase (ubiquinone) 1 alpha subcomplex subunit 5